MNPKEIAWKCLKVYIVDFFEKYIFLFLWILNNSQEEDCITVSHNEYVLCSAKYECAHLCSTLKYLGPPQQTVVH